ncbi:MAG: hypothetical protein HWN67_18680 [Candidatus Helarchaeota archaeon]|nr:hypothetical protein [Candidatus Helarchaeota archaeon]
MSDIAGAVSYKEFLNGRYQDLILESFGQKILDEVINLVNLSKAGKVPEFHENKRKILEKKFFIESIPLDESLKDLDDMNKHPETISGFEAYGNAGGYKTIVKSDNLTLFVNSQKGYLENIEGKRINFKLKGHCSGVVELHDHFFVIHSDNFAVITPKGEIIFDTWDIKFDPTEHMFGYGVRLSSVCKNKETIFFRYSFFNSDYPPGLIKFELNKGFTGRWEKRD